MKIVVRLVRDIAQCNGPRSESPLASPYYDAEEIMADALDVPDCEIDDGFLHTAFTVRGMYQMIVRDNWKQVAKILWPRVSRIATKEYCPDKRWKYCRWRNHLDGKTIESFNPARQSWDEEVRLANERSGDDLPGVLRDNPKIALMFMMVYPHRLTSSAIRWLDWEMRRSSWTP